MPPFPADCDVELCKRFFGAMDGIMEVVMGGEERFYCLFFLFPSLSPLLSLSLSLSLSLFFFFFLLHSLFEF